MITLNQTFSYSFSISQAEVDAFAKCSGDHNPIHWDATYASTTPFKKPIIHGIFSSSIFSKYFGTINPGEGTIYLKQTLEFLRPMFVDTQYEAQMFVKEIISDKHIAVVACKIVDITTGKITLKGEGTLMHKDKIL